MSRPRKQLTNEEYLTLRTRFSAPEENYNLLGSEHPVFGRRKIWDGDYTREQYLRSVDHLIGVLDGTKRDREAGSGTDRQAQRPDVVVWLDKSARPCSWFVDAFWDQIAVPHTSKPRYEFLRIDRRDWLTHMGYTDTEARNAVRKEVRVDAVPEELILRMRSLF
ncbi:hypothetical protein [Mycolicibacterium vanbaalenii]|uniref:Uncharacterized protein n=1 Tax=Mycolicibacterium vanbaalenii (strain DSM 7251 / JCM 13017 / BCRC 16820 / KCTC 9966 / NRRL B-24157 / PYR-1) TaxID=350058 RepID=A1THS8_MYCVP|nr:hypothetical protein [Mycolicibacterium vanbaalenii]ABM16728.1 hypothetical protein Mvan_5971 [Mycolicibacterium vanbaalenii PYR-1]MCV7128344.1 hypothetical protein [Mycolicibacterium vanbaalenii PYR-1]